MSDVKEEDKKPHISFSELSKWQTCPHYRKLIYEDRVAIFAGNIYTTFGTALHEACERKLLDEAIDEVAVFSEGFREALMGLPEAALSEIKKETIVDFEKQGVALAPLAIPALKKYFGDFEVLETEEDLMESISEFTLADYNFKGFIDLVLRTADGKIHIIDWKTTSWGWHPRKRGDKMVTYQLTLYKYFYAKKHRIDPSMIETHFGLLKRTAKKDRVELFRVTSGNRKTENAVKFLIMALTNIHNGKHLKNRLSCNLFNGCEFRNTEHCS